jgi:hypothetical protein
MGRDILFGLREIKDTEVLAEEDGSAVSDGEEFKGEERGGKDVFDDDVKRPGNKFEYCFFSDESDESSEE